MPDHFEELFADLRVATLPRVLPPGADAVRRTAHRRRTTRTTTAAAVVVAVAAATQLAMPAEESTRNAARAAEVLTASGRVGARGTTGRELEATPAPGDYELALVCAGPGTLLLTVQAVRATGGRPTTVLKKRVQCRDLDPRVGETDVITLPENAGLRLSAVPDGPARNRAGWACHLRPR